jgi:hypothetical protein
MLLDDPPGNIDVGGLPHPFLADKFRVRSGALQLAHPLFTLALLIEEQPRHLDFKLVVLCGFGGSPPVAFGLWTQPKQRKREQPEPFCDQLDAVTSHQPGKIPVEIVILAGVHGLGPRALRQIHNIVRWWFEDFGEQRFPAEKAVELFFLVPMPVVNGVNAALRMCDDELGLENRDTSP